MKFISCFIAVILLLLPKFSFASDYYPVDLTKIKPLQKERDYSPRTDSSSPSTINNQHIRDYHHLKFLEYSCPLSTKAHGLLLYHDQTTICVQSAKLTQTTPKRIIREYKALLKMHQKETFKTDVISHSPRTFLEYHQKIYHSPHENIVLHASQFFFQGTFIEPKKGRRIFLKPSGNYSNTFRAIMLKHKYPGIPIFLDGKIDFVSDQISDMQGLLVMNADLFLYLK